MTRSRRVAAYTATPEGVKRTTPAPRQVVYRKNSVAGKLLSKLGGQMETKRAQDWAKAQRPHRGALKAAAQKALRGK